jgi:hypothetical protein
MSNIQWRPSGLTLSSIPSTILHVFLTSLMLQMHTQHMHIQFNSSQKADMLLPRNFYRTFLASGYLRVNQQSNVERLIHINNSQSRITRFHRAGSTESAEQLEFLVSFRWLPSTATGGFWVLFWPLVFPVTASIKEWNPVYTSQLNSSLQIWRGEWGGGGVERFVTERAKTKNCRLYCQSRFGYLVLSNEKQGINRNNTEISHKTAFPKLRSAGSSVFHEMSECVP